MRFAVSDLDDRGHTALLPVWAAVIGGRPPKRMGAALMRRILAFEIQARAKGGLSAGLKRKLARIDTGSTNPSNKMAPSQKLAPGGRLIREWNGVSHVVDVTEKGFVWRDTVYTSLSGIARAITGARWSGPRFFGLTPGVERESAVNGENARGSNVTGKRAANNRRADDHPVHRPDTDQGAPLS